MKLTQYKLLIVYDVLHLYCINGETQPRDKILDYLSRASPKVRSINKTNQLRYFERFKQQLKQLDIPYTHNTDTNQQPLLIIRNAQKHKTLIERLLPTTED